MRRKHKTGVQMKMLRHIIILMTLLTMLLGSGNMANAHVYLNYSTGSDSNDGSTEAKAVQHWSKAFELFKSKIVNEPNTWIVVCATYSQNETINGYVNSTTNARIIRKNGWGGRMFSGTFTFSNVTIDGRGVSGSYASNAVEMIASGSTVTINAGTVIQNNQSTSFGCIWMTNGGVFVMNGGTIQNCSGTEGGAVFSGASNTFTINGGTIKNCHASQNGGAICLRSGTYTLTIKGGSIENCYSPKGGAVFVAPSQATFNVNATITMSGGTIKNCNNTTIVSGAAFYVGSNGTGNSITLNLSGGTIDNCDASGTGTYEGGGGVYCELGELTLNMSGTTIKNCDAVRGGGIHVYGIKAYITLSGGVIDNCSGTTYGGGAYVNGLTSGSWFKMDNTTAGTTGCEIKNCTSPGHSGGAGLFLYGSDYTATLTKGLIHDCSNVDPNNASNGRGGGIVLGNGITANINGDNMKIYDNYSGCYGGGVQLAGASTLNFSKGKIYGNEAKDGAAGIHVTGSSTLNMSGGELYGNYTPGVGGGFHSSEGCTLNITGGKIYDNIAYSQGGGININTRCNLEIPANSTLEMYGNSACRGGAIMVDGATLTIHAGSYHDNKALDSYTPSGSNVQVDTYGTGGAFCLVTANNTNTYASECNLYGGTLDSNTASRDGGAIYIGETTSGTTSDPPAPLNDDPEMHILGAATISNNSALNGHGGGIYMASGTFEMTDGTIDGNSAAQDGGGFYVTTPTGKTSQVDITGGTIEGNSATYGGGFAVVGGTCNIKGAGVSIGTSGNANTASYGAGLYADGGTTTITKGNIQYNEASQDGGGIYANGGTVNVQYAATTDGKIHHNYAGQRGGGLFISSSGSLNLEGKTTLEYNRVPKGELGGGVYLEGTVQAGASSTDVIIVKDNYADNTEGVAITATNRNNIYLPNPVDTQTTDVITVVDNGLDLSSSKIGFSVPHNFVPVIYCSTASYLSPTIMNSEAIFEDSERYTKYYSTTSPYKPNYIYLSADTWFAEVATQPAGFSYDNIDSPEDLAWLISLVNGRTTPSAVTASTLSDITVKLTADIDMKAHTWVPIGFTGKSFNGIFDGNGHTISNVYCSYLGEGEGGTGRGLGLFGTVENATIHDVFVNGVELQVKNQTGSDAYTMGAIANEAKGTTSIYNCTAASKMESTIANTTMGGLVGKLTGGTIHSSAAMPDMTGYTMGGLVGNNSSTIYNSFANAKFHSSGSGYVGGLVGVNTGTVENCYAREQSGSSHGSSFGWLAGANQVTVSGTTTKGNLNYSYAPTTPYTVSGVEGNQTGVNTYSNVIAPYLYNRSGDNAVGSSTLLALLNAWVTNHSGYASWKRTTAGGYSTDAGNINGDYPVHKYSEYKCVASTDGIALDYAASLDDMLMRHTSNATVNLYAHDRTVSSTGNGVMVYIDENISLLQDVGQSSPTSSIEAYTCQTIPGNPRSWHFISSSLDVSGIGFGYSNYSAFNWDPDPCGLTFSTDNDHALFPSDMPAVSSMDMYAFFEPEYHWINLKRRSDSHWHMNDPTVLIEYANEATLTPGKGYLVSIDQNQLLQNRGMLTNGDFDYTLDYTPAQAWAGLVGYNLIGNPYQSYFDFREFVNENTSLWYDDSKGYVEPTYAVYDASMGGYIQYKDGASRGAKTASPILNMHQGFMVRVSAANLRAHFTNDMRTNNGTGVTLRGEQPAFPLVNLTVTDDEGINDFAVLELGREAEEGAEKLRANDSKGWLYLRHNNESYGILFRSEVEDYQPLWFEADEDGTFTLSWETANAEFEGLTLVDNITGVVTDMLANDRYMFEATTDQYASRFKIVVGEWKDTDENMDGPSTSSGTFAFVSNGNLVVNGEGTLQLFDVTGRCIYSTTLSGSQTMTTLPNVTAGVYVLRLSNNNGTRTQKIVLK